MKPFRGKPPNPRRAEERRVIGRVRLRGAAKTEVRRQVFQRSGGRCEMTIGDARCNTEIFWSTFHMSHDRHGPHKSDEVDKNKAACRDCHMVGVHNPKAVRKKPGRPMTRAAAVRYLKDNACYPCEGKKKSGSVFCVDCLALMSPQSRMNLEELTNKEWLLAVADAEIEILEAIEKR